MESESQKQERQIASSLRQIGFDAKTQPGSGNQATSPNDVVVPGAFHIECKTTGAASLAIPHAWFQKAQALAKQFKVPAFIAIRFNRLNNHDFFIVEDTQFYSFLESERQNELLIKEVHTLKRELNELRSIKPDETKIRDPYPTVDPYAAVRKKL